MKFKLPGIFKIRWILLIFKQFQISMGHSYLYRCTHCGYQERFNQGHGFLVHSQPVRDYLKQRTKLFHYKTHNLLKQLAEEKEDLYLKAGFQVYKCPKCKILYDKIEVIVYNDEKMVHKSEFRCSTCRSRLKRTNIHRLKRAVCPKCNKKTFRLEHTNMVLWD